MSDEQPIWVVVILVLDPVVGADVYGPYASREEAQAAIQDLLITYHLSNYDESDWNQVIEDHGITTEVQKLTR